RVDSATNSLEAIFLDGTRQKLKVFAVRLAGVSGEEELFRQWKKDASTRPVRTVYVGMEGGASTPTPPVASPSVHDGSNSDHNHMNGEMRGDDDNNAINNNNKKNVMVIFLLCFV
ncbi:Trypanosoma vivax, partial [Trypanosoma theileri]